MNKTIPVLLAVSFIVFVSGCIEEDDDWFPWFQPEIDETTDEMLEQYCYDQDKNEVPCSPSEGLSVIDGTENIHYVKYNVNIKNIGNGLFDLCYISDSSPPELSVSLPTDSVSILPQLTHKWEGNMFGVAPLELLSQPVRMLVEVTCEYNYGGEPNSVVKSAFKDVTIESDPQFDFTVEIEGEGGSGGDSDVCGDGICGSTEDETTCPEDCPGEDPGPGMGIIEKGVSICYVCGIEGCAKMKTYELTEDHDFYGFDLCTCPTTFEGESVCRCRVQSGTINSPGDTLAGCSPTNWYYQYITYEVW